MELRYNRPSSYWEDNLSLKKGCRTTPPTKSKIGPFSVDSDVAEVLEEIWRKRVKEANEKGEKIPSFSQIVNEALKQWVLWSREKNLR